MPTELPETLELVEGHIRVAGKIKQRVEQHRAVTGREHETVAVGPVRHPWIEAQELSEQNSRDVGHAHRHAGMTRLGQLDCIHGERSNRICHMAEFRVPRRGKRWRRSGRGGGVAHLGKIVSGGARASWAAGRLCFSTYLGSRAPNPAPVLDNTEKEQDGRPPSPRYCSVWQHLQKGGCRAGAGKERAASRSV